MCLKKGNSGTESPSYPINGRSQPEPFTHLLTQPRRKARSLRYGSARRQQNDLSASTVLRPSSGSSSRWRRNASEGSTLHTCSRMCLKKGNSGTESPSYPINGRSQPEPFTHLLTQPRRKARSLRYGSARRQQNDLSASTVLRPSSGSSSRWRRNASEGSTLHTCSRMCLKKGNSGTESPSYPINGRSQPEPFTHLLTQPRRKARSLRYGSARRQQNDLSASTVLRPSSGSSSRWRRNASEGSTLHTCSRTCLKKGNSGTESPSYPINGRSQPEPFTHLLTQPPLRLRKGSGDAARLSRIRVG